MEKLFCLGICTLTKKMKLLLQDYLQEVILSLWELMTKVYQESLSSSRVDFDWLIFNPASMAFSFHTKMQFL